MVASVRVNSLKKVKKIVAELNKNNRFAIYEEFYTYNNKFYVIYYKAMQVEGVKYNEKRA